MRSFVYLKYGFWSLEGETTLYHIDIQNKFSSKSLKAKNIQIQRGRNKSEGNTVQIHFLRVLIGNNLIQFGHIRTAIIVKLAPDTTSFRKVFENHRFEAKKVKILHIKWQYFTESRLTFYCGAPAHQSFKQRLAKISQSWLKAPTKHF